MAVLVAQVIVKTVLKQQGQLRPGQPPVDLMWVSDATLPMCVHFASVSGIFVLQFS